MTDDLNLLSTTQTRRGCHLKCALYREAEERQPLGSGWRDYPQASLNLDIDKLFRKLPQLKRVVSSKIQHRNLSGRTRYIRIGQCLEKLPQVLQGMPSQIENSDEDRVETKKPYYSKNLNEIISYSPYYPQGITRRIHPYYSEDFCRDFKLRGAKEEILGDQINLLSTLPVGLVML
jgi:hypothetical protein